MAFDLSKVPCAADTYNADDLGHLRIVLTEEQIRAYPSLSEDARREMLRLAWASLDPTPTTERNERMEMHYRRLSYARENFARQGSPPWDKRGELLIRYGSPQMREVIPMTIEYATVIPPREIWIYSWPAMAFDLADPLLKGDYQDGFSGVPSSRPDLRGEGPIDAPSRLDLEIPGPTVSARAARFRTEQLLGQGHHAWQEGTQAYLHDFGGGKLDVLFDVLNFATSAPEKTSIEIGLLVRATDLKFEDHLAELSVDVVAKTMDYHEVARASHVVRHPQPPSPSTQLMADRIALELAPGDYRLGLQVRDIRSGDVGVFTTESRVRKFMRGLEISDLQLASTIEAGRSGHRFSKGDILVVPHPGAVFPQGSDVRLYFEIYGLTLAPSRWAEYTVTFTVSSKGSNDGDRPSVAISSDANAKTRDIQRYFSFGTSTMEPGLYDVEVHVTDKIAKTSAWQKATLRVDARKAAKGR